MENLNCTKRTYHPPVIFFFYTGLLEKEHLALIPASTRHYWKSIDHNTMYGFKWVEEFSSHHRDIQKLMKHRIVFKSARICCRVLDSFVMVFTNIKAYKRIIRKNSSLIVSTIDNLLLEMPLKKACKIYRITTNQYYRWKNKVFCSASVLNHCYKLHPHQLTLKEVASIKEIINAPGNFYKPLSSLYYELMREGKLFCSLATLYKYAALVSERMKRPVNNMKPDAFRASRIFEYLHIDTTHVMTEMNGSRRVAFVKDNFSKALLHRAIVPDGSSDFIRDLLKETFEKFGLHYHTDAINIISDGGSENKGEVLSWVYGLNKNTVVKLTANADFPHTNNMIESLFHIFKNEFLYGREIVDDSELNNQLNLFYEYYNWRRFPIELYGYAPMEVVNGAVPDRNRFKGDIKKAQKHRYLSNITADFCEICK